jgi:hypothetical protein
VDDELREAERGQTGDLESRAQRILLRVRAGVVSVERLLAAARLGDVSAARVARSQQQVWSPYLDPRVAARGRALLDGSALLTGAERIGFSCDCARRVLERWTLHDPRDARPTRALAVAWDPEASAERLAQAAASALACVGEGPWPPNYQLHGGQTAEELRAEARQISARAAARAVAGAAQRDLPGVLEAVSVAVLEAAIADGVVSVRRLGGGIPPGPALRIAARPSAELEQDWQVQRLCDYLLGEGEPG